MVRFKHCPGLAEIIIRVEEDSVEECDPKGPMKFFGAIFGTWSGFIESNLMKNTSMIFTEEEDKKFMRLLNVGLQEGIRKRRTEEIKVFMPIHIRTFYVAFHLSYKKSNKCVANWYIPCFYHSLVETAVVKSDCR
jgi:hypothetical protein